MLQVRPSPPRNHVLRDVRLQVKKLEDPLPRASAPHSRWLRLATHGFHRLIDVLIQTREGPTESQESFRTPLLLQELGSRTYPKLGNKYNTESLIYIYNTSSPSVFLGDANLANLFMFRSDTSDLLEGQVPTPKHGEGDDGAHVELMSLSRPLGTEAGCVLCSLPSLLASIAQRKAWIA